MEKVLERKNLGEFFTKMYDANKGKRIEVSIHMEEDKIQIYYKDRATHMFESIKIMDEYPSLDSIVESLSKEDE